MLKYLAKNIRFGTRLFFAGLFTLFVVWIAESVGTAEQKGAMYKILDKNGQENIVSDLKVYYQAEGGWFGDKPSMRKDILIITVVQKEGRVAVEENLEIPLKSIKVVEFVRERDGGIIIKKRDGTTLLLGKLTGRESHSQKAVSFDTYILHTSPPYTVQNQRYYLDGFEGKAKTKSGKEGRYFINQMEVSMISLIEQ
jgi:hypothetical protein